MKKDTFYAIIGIAFFVAVIGLLMAWSDGYLDGTLLASILKVVFPAILAAHGLFLVVSFWFRKFPIVATWIILFLAACVFLLLPVPRAVLLWGMVLEVALIMVTLIAFLIKEYL